MASGTSLPVSVVIPVYGAAAQLRTCLDSLAAHLPPGCEVIIADDATPDNSIKPIANEFASRLTNLRYVRRPANVGFVENCNQAVQQILQTGRDILLLNSDTEVTAGFLGEMYEVLHAHEKHGAVAPRSNNATIFSIPVYERMDPSASHDLWLRIRPLLPRFQVMPTCVGFCMLVKNRLIREFGLFDSIYSPGYNEENDMICRINRYGYSAVCANHAYVYHYESASFGTQKKGLEERNRAILDDRYPEYNRKISSYLRSYIDPVEHFAPVWGVRRKRILYDLYHLPAKHSGTSEFALNLLLHLAPLLEEKYDLFLGLNLEARQFFENELVGYKMYDEQYRAAGSVFDLVFKPCQLFAWADLYRLIRLGARIACTHLDIIAVRCDYLSGPNLRELFGMSADVADLVTTISRFSRDDYDAFYNRSSNFKVIYLGTDELAGDHSFNAGYILVVGNKFYHKAIDRAISALAGIGELLVIGGAPPSEHQESVRWIQSGSIGRSEMTELYERAAVIVYPSLYEGFGLPIVDALALGKPVAAIDTVVNRELAGMSDGDLLNLVPSVSDLTSVVSRLLRNRPVGHGASAMARSWRDVAKDYAVEFERLLETEVDVARLRRRWEMMRLLDAYHSFG